MTPWKSAPGVTTTSESVNDTSSATPVSTTAPVTVRGLPGNGLVSLFRTGTDTGLPWWASTSSGAVWMSGLVEPTILTVSWPSTSGLYPSATVNGIVWVVPFGTVSSACAVTALPDTVAVMPFPPATLKVRSSLSGSLTYRDRSTVESSPAATSSTGVPVSSGGMFLAGVTSIGSVSTAVSPSGSSGPEPSVTSNVTEAAPE